MKKNSTIDMKRPIGHNARSPGFHWLPWTAAVVVFGVALVLAVNASGSQKPDGRSAPWTDGPTRESAAPLAAVSESAPAGDSAALATADARPAPDFSIVTTSGKPFRLSEQRGKAVVLNFNATG